MFDFDLTTFAISAFFGIVGFALYRYGKRIEKYSWVVSGVVLCIYPYFVSNVYALVGIGVGLMVVPYFLEI